ncbi:uncharacterized protein LOC135087201 [Ostrinia nubilalis]|uniref:uncharacterized protein LOC135087201 n=1 Tax=Ostrinia nubilalis TaxID=29057 RepID=UPI003082511C
MCRKFASQDVSQRRNFVQTSGLCYNCLGANHGAKACQNKLKCKLCHRRHHSLLHPTGTENYSPHTNGVNVESDGKDSSRGFGPKGEAGNAGKSSAFVACNFSTGNVNQVLLATALVNAESRNGSNQVLRALLDQGSEGNFVTESTVIDLKLKKSPIHGTISGLGGDNGLVSKAMATSLGWILSGIVSSPVNQARSVVALHCQLHEGDELLKKFWEIESGMDLTKEQTYTEDERKCEEIFTKTTTRDKEGRGKTRDIAEKRLQSLERRFEKSEKFHKSYKEVIEEYIELGHITEVQKPDVNRNESVYLPHHAVIREDKDTTKRDESGDIKDYKHLRVTFGTASAPFLAVRTLQQVAIDEGTEYPIAAELVPQKFYMDDLMCGCEDVNEGMEIYGQMKGLLRKGGFQLQKWASNDEQLMKLIEKEEKKEEKKNGNQESKERINIKMDEIMKILGLTWERRADNFRYKVNIPDLQLPITKRKIIADISRLFDPLGWITPCIILAKAMIQKLWITGIGWDEEVPKELMKEWCAYRNELMSITDVKIPRWVETRANDVKRELHGFCDASKIAYAAVVYLRIIDSDGIVHVTLIAAKSKVAPIKQVSIPRLELCGAVELTRLLIDVGRVLKIESSNVHAWTDSTIVLAWLNSLPSRWKVFVANRVSEILTSMNPYQWSHVKTSENPADCASRGVSPANLINQSLWFSGPSFLRSKKVEYKKPTEIETEMEAVKVHTLKKEENIFDIWEKFSSLTKLIRVLTYCRRFLNLQQSKSNQQYKGYLKSEELRETLKICIKKDQEIHFEKEIEAINKKFNIQKNSRLKSLNPILDENNILRVGGRLEEADLRENKKHPIIMAKHSSLTKLIIVDAHNQTLHGGPQLTLNYIRNKYFIIGAKQLIKAHVRKCVECVKNSGRTYQQLMGQLPSVRAKPARPFQHSGVDFAGPIQMRTARGRGHKSYKGYICLFVCMSTKAVHVEAVSDLTAQGFLQAFKRFVARRGRCEHIWSDNGTNFVGATTEIRKLFADEKDGILAEIAENLANNCTTWHFIPPHAPNFGGLWEAGVKSVKHHLKRVIGTSTLTFEEMATLIMTAVINFLFLSYLVVCIALSADGRRIPALNALSPARDEDRDNLVPDQDNEESALAIEDTAGRVEVLSIRVAID